MNLHHRFCVGYCLQSHSLPLQQGLEENYFEMETVRHIIMMVILALFIITHRSSGLEKSRGFESMMHIVPIETVPHPQLLSLTGILNGNPA